MCTTTIDADCILAILLQDASSVTVRRLKEVRVAIEQEFSSVYVDLTKEGLISAVNRWQEFLVWENDVISRRLAWPPGYVDEVSQAQIPDGFLPGILRVLDVADKASSSF
jgi:hypothetical protein